jgi:hypothetical protein
MAPAPRSSRQGTGPAQPPAPGEDVLHRRDQLIRRALLRARAGLHVPEDQALGEETELDATHAQFLDAAAALTIPVPSDAIEAGKQVSALRDSLLWAYAGTAGNWAAGILGALAGAWGRNARLWPTAIAVADLRDILTAAGIPTIAIPPAWPSQAKTSRGGHDPDGRPVERTHRLLAAALKVISANPAYSGSHTLAEAITACTPRPDLEPALSVRLAAAAAQLSLPAVPAPDRPVCEGAIAASVRWCDHRTGEAAEAAGQASADAWTDAVPAANAARDAAFAAFYHAKADEVRTLEDASDSHDDDASSPASRLADLANGFTMSAVEAAATAAADPDAFLAALANIYHEYA